MTPFSPSAHRPPPRTNALPRVLTGLLLAPLLAAADPTPAPTLASAYETALKTQGDLDRAILASAFLDARQEVVRLRGLLHDLRRDITTATADAATRDTVSLESRKLLIEAIERRTRAELNPTPGETAPADLAAAAADRQAKSERIQQLSDERLDAHREELRQRAGQIHDALNGALFARVDAAWLQSARGAASDLENHLRLAGVASPAWAARSSQCDQLDTCFASGESDLQAAATEASRHIHPVQESMSAVLAAIKDHTEAASLLEDLPPGTSRYSLLLGWRHSQFEDGSGNKPIAGVMVYHHFRSNLMPQITVAALFTGAEYKDSNISAVGLTSGATAVESLQTSQSFLFGGSLYWPATFLREPMDLNLDGFTDAGWTFGPVLKAGAYVRAAETDQGNSTQANGAAGLRFALGTNSFLDLCYGRNQELYSDRLVIGVQMPILLLGSQKPGNRLYFSADGNIGLNPLPTKGVEGQMQSDDIFRFSLVLELPVQSLARKFSIPYLAE
jgi:hypothetical protein